MLTCDHCHFFGTVSGDTFGDPLSVANDVDDLSLVECTFDRAYANREKRFVIQNGLLRTRIDD